MSRYLITGSSGFVGRKFIQHLSVLPGDHSVMGVDTVVPGTEQIREGNIRFDFRKVDLRERDRLCKVIYDFAPEYVLHLASYSSVAASWKSPCASFQNNLNIFLNLVESIRSIGLGCRLLSVGSSEEYGNVDVSDLPLREDNALNPSSPFAIARLSQELVAKLYAEVHGLDIIMTRSFNHIGPGMNSEHAIASFARQLVEFKMTGLNSLLLTGDTGIVRDFVDVRDVVRAYQMLLVSGRKGEVYNVCSGCGISLNNAIRIMCDILNVEVTLKENRQLLRPKDNAIMIGSNEKIRNDVKWTTEISFEESLSGLLEHFIQTRTSGFGNAGPESKKYSRQRIR